ncbi:hypothetical protein PGT21_050238 [Puccinia graminis f. sp. tritici]|uniref:Retrotransposon gag domain-containing protein n=1 Tax=Puccinia graminis f. sp. tritici TaxID=56615 RepID=A0A5B0RHK3_PUCGR|nr:hypothetical protein PGT21_050238 [Puccinia graminis f. sp. tritici]KAA1125401.1 hypothetical protein PGTUg99_050022 [Puccinia graminis f. sp. tritici]
MNQSENSTSGNTPLPENEMNTHEAPNSGETVDQRMNKLDSRMDRVATTLETLIGIIKATEPPQPQPTPLVFDPVTTAPPAVTVDRSRFAFVQTPVQSMGFQQQAPQGSPQVGFQSGVAAQPQQEAIVGHRQGVPQAPRPFPSHDHPIGEDQGINPVYLEPQKIPELWFSGETKQLASFLRAIRDFLYPRQSFFSSESRMIVWISRHFGYRPSELKNVSQNTPCAAENWYDSLVLSNARAQGENDPYADLDRIPFLHPMLVSVKAFETGLIDSFGDKFQLDSAKKALAACKQGRQSVEEYNAQYSTLCYQVENSEDARIDRYVEGLNFDIVSKAMSTEWLQEPTLAGKMRRALDASRQLAALSKMPNRQSSIHTPGTPSNAPRAPQFVPAQVYHHPNSSSKPPDAMDIDAISAKGPQTPEQRFERLFRTVCLAQRVCFRCLQKTVPPDHTNSINCPNGRVTPEARKKFVEQYRYAVPVQVSEVSFGPRPPGESITRKRDLLSVPSPYQARPLDRPQQRSPSPPVQSTSLEQHHDTQDLDSSDFAFQEEVEEVGVSTVHVRLDCSKAGRMVIPVSFKTANQQSAIASVLIDTGSMANFISDRFVSRHHLETQARKNPIRCVGFDGSSGVGGMVTRDWSGEIVVSSTDSQPINLPCSFGVTRLGSVDAIFGLPWLDSQSWSASGSVQQGHHPTLGETQVFVVDSSDLGEEFEG